ncbi:MAG: Glu-tRNA(Gln) amidotransferase subunit GatE [Candidatus Aenigmatarchaeota archaeon]
MDYEKIGLKIGLEVHQQLNTKKLFCNCSTQMLEQNLKYEIRRRLRPVVSELGKVDRAALFEFFRNREFIYHGYENEACLVDLDEEPPHEINKEALDIAIAIALNLGLNIPDELYIMRKLVLDGSAITSFQRTILIGYGPADFNGVRIKSLCLEEDAAKIESQNKNTTTYSLSRLGVPLIEVGTEPDIRSPEQAKMIAEDLGLLFRSFNVKRGIGTIRQDVNISIEKGARVEIKGWQDLRALPKLIENEVLRQINLLNIRDKIKSIAIKEPVNVSKLFGKNAFALRLPEFMKYASMELCKGRSFKTELLEYGTFYDSEITSNNSEINKLIKPDKDEMVVVALGADAEKAINAIFQRARYCLIGIPEETRKPNQDATTSYARPLPGSARMYPETDLLPLRISKVMPKMPETMLSKRKKLEKILSKDIANQIIKSRYYPLFEKIVNRKEKDSKFVSCIGAMFTSVVKDLKRRGIEIENISDNDYIKISEAIEKNRISKRTIPNILTEVSKGKDVNSVIKKFELVGEEELKKIIKDVVKKNRDKDISALMGIIMNKIGGRADGELVIKELKKMMKDA